MPQKAVLHMKEVWKEDKNCEHKVKRIEEIGNDVKEYNSERKIKSCRK